jgi:hypothetical protein
MITYEKSGDVVKKIEIKEEVYSISELEKEIADLEKKIDGIEFEKESNDERLNLWVKYENEVRQNERNHLENELLEKEQLLIEINGN